MDREHHADRAQRGWPGESPLSYAQWEAWLNTPLAGDVPVGNEWIGIRCPDGLDTTALEDAFAEFLSRHEAWRTTFVMEHGRPVPVIGAPGSVSLPEVDLRDSLQAEADARALARADAVRPFDLEHGPLYRALLVRLGNGHHLYLTLHRAIADRVSLERLLLPELATLYATRVGGSASPPAPTVQYADFAARQRAGPSIPPRASLARTGPAPASFVQRRMWFFDQVSPGGAAYNIPLLLELSGPLAHERLERALAMLVERHAVLRTTLQVLDGDVVQVVGAAPPPVPILDLSRLTPGEREAAVRRQTTEQARCPFDLAQGPLVRTSLLRLAPDAHLLTVTAHHAVLDGWSIAIFVRELAEAYAALTEARPLHLPALPIQYADFAEWQRAWLTDGALAPQLAYWRRQLAGAPELLDLPADRPHPPAPTFEVSVCTHVLSADVARALRGLSQREGVTMFMTTLAAFKSLLFRYSGQADLVVGSPIAGRNQPGTDELLGVFINTLVLRTDLSGDPTFRELLARVREVTLGAYAHQDVPFERLVEELRPGRHPDRNPLFQVLFNLLNSASSFEADGGGVRFALRPSLDLAAAAESLTLYAFDGAEGLHLWLVYGRERFDPATAERILGHFETLVRGIVENPDRRLSALPLLTTDERQRVLAEWNATDADLPLDETYARQFEAQVARTPEAVAVIADAGALTYAELDGRASRLARRLVAAGVGPDRVVALLGERSLDFLTWILAVFKAGGAYLPLDPRHPAARHAAILTGSAAVLVLVDDAHAAVLEAALAEMDDVARPARLRAVEGAPLEVGAGDGVTLRGYPGDLAYVIYTSGSTGVPKGAMVEQVGMLNHLHAKIRDLGLTDADTVAQNASQCFDISVWQFLAPLLVGGRVRIVSDDVAADAPQLLALVDRDAISVVEIVPSVLASAFPDAAEARASTPALARLRWLIVTGEAAPPALCRRWLHAYPHTALMNGYGPTECSDDVTHHVITEPPAADATQVPIGRPIANMRIYVLDQALTPMPIGVPGELCVGGIGVGRGYLGDPVRTAEAFVADPFAERPGARLYRTGDLARWRADGTLEFLGRLDSQVKIRGLRIELGEIEAVLRREPSVHEAAVVVQAEGAAQRLVAYVVARAGAVLSAEALREHARRMLPAYMVPAAFVLLPALPLTPNGKVDRRALAAASEAPMRPALATVAPAGSLEAQLIELWQEVLGVRPIGASDDFFELGGDSLTAVRIIQQVADLTGSALPLGALYESPTVAALARLLREGTLAPGSPAPAVTLNRGGDHTPLVLFHGMLTGGAFYALRLARQLGTRQPVHVVPPFTGAGGPVPHTVEAMAAAQLDLVRTLQPRGPYRLAGYCNGGLVAYEIARRLREAGETVDLVALVAAAPVTSLARTGRVLRSAARLSGLSPESVAEPLARVRSLVEALSEVPRRRRLAFVAAKCLGLARRAWPRAAARRTPDLMDVYHRVVMRYFPRRAPGRVVVFWPEHEPWGPADAAAAAWRRLVPEVDVHVVPGDHLAVVHDHLDVLAERLAPYLDGHAPPRPPVPETFAERLRLGLPPFVVDLADAMERAREMSL